MRMVKLLIIALGTLLALIAVLLASVWLFVNPNDYKRPIERLVKDSTGRELALPGAIKLSVFPWIALDFGPASLGNPPGFGAEPFASVRHVALRVKLLPLLLHRQLQIGRVAIDGLDLRLLRNAAGKGNWQGFGGSAGQGASESAGEANGALPELAGLILKDGRIRYGPMRADHVDLAVGHLGAGIAVPVKLALNVTTKPDTPPVGLEASFDLTPDAKIRHFRVAALELRGKIHPRGGGGTVDWTFSAPDSTLDLKRQTANIPAFTLHFADARATGSLDAAQILGSPTANGAFRLDPLALRELLDRLGIAPPRTGDAKALERLSASGDFAYGANAVRLTKLDLRLDDTRLQGSAAITNLKTRAASFDLALDHIDFDRYLSPAPRSAPTAPSSESGRGPFNSLRLDGQLAIGSARIDGLDLGRVRIGIVAGHGVTHIAPANAQLYGGTTAGTVTIDDRGATPVIQITQSVTDVDVTRLLQDFAKTKRLSGRGNLTATLTARGRGADAMLRTLNGHVTADLAGGAIEGIDLWSDVYQAMALLRNRSLPAGAGAGRTTFDTFRASADITNGVATTKDLAIVSQNLHVTGRGTTNLVTRAIDYRLQATIRKAPGANAPTLANVPIMVTGTLTAPKVRPDLAGIATDRLRQTVETRAQQLQKTLESKLKNFFHH
ncbi:MAG TPA: AsmA family protein [Steroidobacteraceae bacterium]|nr:AsmA family protein [Steroidobacteraceae bacterium]